MVPGPTKAAVQACAISGADMTARVLKISVFESICKAYLTGTLVIRDDNNVVNDLNLQGGEPVQFTFTAGDGLNYSQTLYLLKMQGEPMNQNLRTIKYTMDLIGPEYFRDRANMVQQSFKSTTGTGIAQSIVSRFLGTSLTVPLASSGLFGMTNPYVVSSTKPFKAINDVRKLMSFGSGVGLSMFFRDAKQLNLTQVESLFSGMGTQQSFEQRNTWGSNWQNVLGAYNAILAASTSVNEKQGRGGAQSTSVTAQYERKARDLFSTKMPFADAIQAASGVLASVTGGHGGLQHFPVFDSTVIPKENLRNTGADMAYQAKVVDGPQVTIKVPIQTGISCTVGKGVSISLIPPTGDYTGGNAFERLNGNKLVADLCHTVEMGEQGMIGTTTMRLVTPPGS